MHPRCCWPVDWMLPHSVHRPAPSWVHYTTSCKHSLVFLRMGEIIAWNMLSWLELLMTLYCCIYLVVYIIAIFMCFSVLCLFMYPFLFALFNCTHFTLQLGLVRTNTLMSASHLFITHLCTMWKFSITGSCGCVGVTSVSDSEYLGFKSRNCRRLSWVMFLLLVFRKTNLW
jgi:hypothetical protein